MDGEWEAPQVPNLACESAPGCGTWKRPMIDNPDYKGKWKAPMIDNPNYQVLHSDWPSRCLRDQMTFGSSPQLSSSLRH